jgi:two-component system cell cycle response regulator
LATVLIIDDSDSVRQRIIEVLGDEPRVTQVLTASDGIAGFKLLMEHPVDLILCDLIMPILDGFKFLALKQTRAEFADVPVIMLTGEEDVRAKVRGLEAGASDYLTKPFDAHELLARVRIHLKLKQLQDDLRDKNQRLEQLTRTDELTGLNNRRFFMEMLRNEFRRSERYGTPVVYVMVDVDHFKKVNDTHGHLVGDRALVAVSQVLTRTARSQDVLGRYGGEEFGIIMPHTELKGGELAAERHRRLIEETVLQLDSGPLKVTASFGLATFPRPDIRRVEDLIEMADQALYAAKDAGRNRVGVAPPVLVDAVGPAKDPL